MVIFDNVVLAGVMVIVGLMLSTLRLPVLMFVFPIASFIWIVIGNACPELLTIPYVARLARERFRYPVLVLGRLILLMLASKLDAHPDNPAMLSILLLISIINPLPSLIV